MADGILWGLFWRVLDGFDHVFLLARLRILDTLAGPEPETLADQQRTRDQEEIDKAFPGIEPGETGRGRTPHRTEAKLQASATGAIAVNETREFR